MHLDEQRLLSVSTDLWASMLGLRVGLDTQVAGHRERTWTSCIPVTGPWQGAILLECPESIARHAAVMLHSADGDTASAEDIQDALRELSDAVARRIRPLLPEQVELSKPEIVEGPAQPVGVAGLEELRALRLSCEGRPVRISLLGKGDRSI